MVNIESWMDGLAGKLKKQFGPRLLFLGLQGSYGRGEANEDSDIDVVTVLDWVTLVDLDAYRAVVSAMPEGDKACGFLCGFLPCRLTVISRNRPPNLHKERLAHIRGGIADHGQCHCGVELTDIVKIQFVFPEIHVSAAPG